MPNHAPTPEPFDWWVPAIGKWASEAAEDWPDSGWPSLLASVRSERDPSACAGPAATEGLFTLKGRVEQLELTVEYLLLEQKELRASLRELRQQQLEQADR